LILVGFRGVGKSARIITVKGA